MSNSACSTRAASRPRSGRWTTWRAHPQGQALAGEPLIAHRQIGDGRTARARCAICPKTGVRVLDLTSVIAGPVCTRFLGALGADVLRIDPPRHPDVAAGAVADSLLGKRSAFLDLVRRRSPHAARACSTRADVVVCGYRPGALDRFGLDEAIARSAIRASSSCTSTLGATRSMGRPPRLRQRRAGADGYRDARVGHRTPSRARFRANSSITGRVTSRRPRRSTGSTARASDGGTHVRRLSLARTAMWLTAQGVRPWRETVPDTASETSEWLVALESAKGPVVVVSPPGALGERPLQWPFAPTTYAGDPAAWPTQ